ncbi:GGDEF domain-containing protein [Rhizobium sp. PL01]|uniref:GGDEF domain-containing protein n=1 Tax=Rhizobium sp. PL01 TaxID=3085631 RepID=UPI002980C4DA|nr:GGDEF domain-containing protein [Rhizobium sp. PL01]MDW5317819.1 GGDEF domain-containing protein [Rhizobium sp. PL01]
MPLRLYADTNTGRFGGLRGRLWFMALLAVICTLLLATSTISASIVAFRKAQAGAESMRQFTAIFDAANLISAERGPANSLMTASDAKRAEELLKWRGFVTSTDVALAVLERRDIPNPMIDVVRVRLAAARALIEAIGQKPRHSRRYEEIRAAIGAMFDARDSYRRIIEWQSGEILRRDSDLAAIVLQGIALTDLREYAGRLGSYLIAPMAAGIALTPQDIAASNAARGRLLEVWDLIGPRSALPVSDPIRLKCQEADDTFMRQGLALIDEQMALGKRNGQFSLDGVGLTQRYVALMQPLGELRNIYLTEIAGQFETAEREALVGLYRNGLTTAVLLMLVLGLVAAVQVYILRPLLRGAQAVIALADERPANLGSAPGEVQEIRRLYGAIGILSQRLGERALLTRQLEILATTDGLTGLLNRRALEDRVAAMAVDGARYLILLDIDHFKSINDRYGHPFGDTVLRAIAELMRQFVGSSGSLARFGGEEFALLLESGSLAEAACVARKLRKAIENCPLEGPDGEMLTVTASFGVAGGARLAWSEIVVQTDAALYRAKDAGRNRVRVFRAPV